MTISAEFQAASHCAGQATVATGGTNQSCDCLIATGSFAVVVLLLLFALFLDFFRCAVGRGQGDLYSFGQAAF